MTKYHNPYHFVPVTGGPRPDDLPATDFQDGETNHVTHDRYVDGAYSGRIICRLTTETPVFIGAKRTKKATDQAPAEVAPFKLDSKPAIPATSLRGLISSIAEAASNSALRVLADTPYSYRKWSRNSGTTKVGIASLFSFFNEIDPELMPFDESRNQITIAEQLFGFVEDQRVATQNPALSLAGRVYFSHAQTTMSNECLLPEVTLRILDSPKPPSPAMYFKQKSGRNRHIAKHELNPRFHLPQGRKFYLHHRPEEIQSEGWRTRNNDRLIQKVKITPIKSGAVFYFHVDFDNLSAREMGLLLYSLKPTPQFKHKLGMGKPLGLGAINIEPVGLFRINRQSRYSAAGLFAPRYSECWIADDAGKPSWPEIYHVERDANGTAINVAALREDFRATMNPDIRQAVELIGNPSSIRHRVVTPLVERNGREADSEQETFQWFVANDRQQAQALEPLNANSREMPALNSLP